MAATNGCGATCSVNSEMLMGKLRGEFGFEGIVATDCGALNDALTQHNFSKTVCPTCNASEGGDLIARMAKEAGVDSNCGSGRGTIGVGGRVEPP